jgi:hypothetical protein
VVFYIQILQLKFYKYFSFLVCVSLPTPILLCLVRCPNEIRCTEGTFNTSALLLSAVCVDNDLRKKGIRMLNDRYSCCVCACSLSQGVVHRNTNICSLCRQKHNSKYRENFCFVDRLHGSAPHGDRCTAGCEAHTNFADESACLTADNVRNEVVTIHRSQEVLKMLSLYT